MSDAVKAAREFMASAPAGVYDTREWDLTPGDRVRLAQAEAESRASHRFGSPRHEGAGSRVWTCERCGVRTRRFDAGRAKPLPPCTGGKQ